MKKSGKSTVLKYAGNKRNVMAQIQPYLGDWGRIERYIEPFAGALGSSLNAAVPDHVKVCLSDANEELVNLYDQLLANAADVERMANSFLCDEKSYYEVREWDRSPSWPGDRTSLERAARVLYLNKRGFNGLYRVNRKGYYTTPWGRNPNPHPIDVVGHSDFLHFLRRANGVACVQWDTVIQSAGSGDVVYCDPPYVDIKDPTKEFGGYVGGFGWSEQVRLRDELEKAVNRGARAILSNSYCEQTLELYKNWNLVEIEAPRSLSRSKESRGRISELVAWLSPNP
jgi:DNA adenine methylase